MFSNIKLSSSLNKELANLKFELDEVTRLSDDVQFLNFAMENVESTDQKAISFVNDKLAELEKSVDALYVSTLLSGKYDKNIRGSPGFRRGSQFRNEMDRRKS